VQNPNPEGAMPKGLARGATLTDIAAYVAQAADRPGQDTGLLASAVQAPGAGKPAVEQAGKLQIAADPSGQLAYVTNKATAGAGSVTVEMPNTSSAARTPSSARSPATARRGCSEPLRLNNRAFQGRPGWPAMVTCRGARSVLPQSWSGARHDLKGRMPVSLLYNAARRINTTPTTTAITTIA
jgi:hypothetical protein